MVELCRKVFGFRDVVVQVPVSRAFRGRRIDLPADGGEGSITVGKDVTVGELLEAFKAVELHEAPPASAVPNLPLVGPVD